MSHESQETNNELTYADAGVNIEAGDELVERIKRITEGIGGFGGLFPLPIEGYKNPVLVSGTDGVGTKLLLAIEMGILDTVGIDLVAMSVNDILCAGAKPLFFLDYYAASHLNVDDAEKVVTGIAKGCRESDCILLGGETAEMPGLYKKGDFDLAGFAVGIVDRDKIIDGRDIEPGDIVIGLPSSGIHSNGYSLVRKIIENCGLSLHQDFHGRSLGEVLLEPTRIYVKPVLELLKKVSVKGIAHITGGGIPGNLVRVLPEGTSAVINTKSWEIPPVFNFLKEKGSVNINEMFRTFNMGIGMALVVSKEHEFENFNGITIGKIVEGNNEIKLEGID